VDNFSLSSFVLRSFAQDAGIIVLLLIALIVSALVIWIRLPRDLSVRVLALRHAVGLCLLTSVFAFVCAARVSHTFAAPLVSLAVPRIPTANCDPAPRVTVVLGGGIESAKVANIETMLRLQRAVAYLYESHSPTLQAADRIVVLSGGVTVPALGVAESVVMSEVFRSLGGAAFADRVLVEDESKTTYENALYLRPLLAKLLGNEPTEPQAIALVTSAEHMLRSRLTFEKQGFAVCAVVTVPREFRARTLFSFRSAANFAGVLHEYLGLLGYWLSGRL
jgi:uncharacterized SAM-binding protein YcdF (DUF218 family)